MAKAFVIDLSKCNGCHNCQIACKDEHCDQAWLPYAAAQPETGQFWCRVITEEQGQVPWVRLNYRPQMCAHCASAPCAQACSIGAFTRRDDGLLLIDPGLCTGCGSCVDACPIDAVFFNEAQGIAQKCTGCAHLLDNGWDVPRCVDACASGALMFGEEDELADVLKDACVPSGLENTGTRLHYLNRPGLFIAGTLVDFEADEVVIGAEVTLLDAGGAAVATCATNDFGDFKFNRLEPGEYTLAVPSKSGAMREIAVDLRDGSKSAGAVAFS